MCTLKSDLPWSGCICSLSQANVSVSKPSTHLSQFYQKATCFDVYWKYVPILHIIQCSCISPHSWSRLRITFLWIVPSLSKWAQPSTLVRNYPGIGSTSTFHMQCFLFFILKKVHVVHFRVYNVTSICKDNSWYINWITNIVHILILLDCYDYGSATSYRIDCLHVCCPISVK